jgi:hypothetical protein
MEDIKIEEVYRNIYDLYDNPDTSSKEKASKWLEGFQKSVSLIAIRVAGYNNSSSFICRYSRGK